MDMIKKLIESAEAIPGGFFIYEAFENEEIIYANDVTLSIFGCNTIDEFMELTQKSFKGLVHEDDLGRVEKSISKQINDKNLELDYVEYRIKRLDGEIRYIEDFGRYIETENGSYYLVFISDITDKYNKALRSMESVTNKLKKHIKYDSLTGLYNKQGFIKVIEKNIAKDVEAYVIYLDINKFTLYSNLFGLDESDSLLLYVARILKNLEKNHVMASARLYHDIFAICLKGTFKEVENLIDTISALCKEYEKGFDITISFGIYKIEDHHVNPTKMLDYAEIALESIKGKYDKIYAIYSDALEGALIKEQYIINNLEPAIENKEFLVYLQPKYDLVENKIYAAEALVRWKHGNTLISPGEFIPIFEKNGQIIKLDFYVWECICKLIRNRLDNKQKIVPISVNVSRIFFSLNSFIDNVEELVNKYQIPREYLEFEITESLFSNANLIKKHVNKLRELGFKVHMDDFGAGYSGLSVLKDVDFDVMKLDLKFFEASNKKARIIVEAVINMANKLNIPVIAEGVESLEHVIMLKEYGCRYAQGFFYSKPIPIDGFLKLIDDKKSEI